jgi:flagellar basal-body rod protein FlgC
MGMYSTLGVSATGMAAQRLRMDTVASNLANADSTLGPGQAYRRRMVSLAEAPSGPQFQLSAPEGVRQQPGEGTMHGVQVTAIVEDESELRREYEPGHPLADAEGYVTKPNVNTVTEMVDMIAASRSYQANVSAFEATKSMARSALRILG